MVEKTRVADYVINKLLSFGVDHFFIIVGGNVMYLNDAIRVSGAPYTAFHHEQSATMAAEAHARITGKLSCVVVTSGPGASNVVTGVAGAFYDSAPVLVICGNSKSSDLRTEQTVFGVRQIGTFELPIHEVCEPICKFAALVQDVTQVPEVLESAMLACVSGRPGPAVLSFPIDIQGSEIQINHSSITTKVVKDLVPSKSSKKLLRKMILDLNNSIRPAIFVGHGVRASGQRDSLLRILQNLNIPIFTTQLAKDFIPYSDPLFIGHVGVRGDRAGNIGIHDADFILTVGTSLHQQNIGYEPELFAPHAKKFILDFEYSVSGKKLPFEATYLNLDIRELVDFIESELSTFKSPNENWLRHLQELKQSLQVRNEPHDISQNSINLYEFVDSLAESLYGEETIVTDAGLCFYVMGQGFKLKRNQRYLVSGGLGSMGYALPAAIGASLKSTSWVIVVTGDGSMQMNVQELATLQAIRGKIKIFVINNGGYASLKNTQESFFGTPFIGVSASSGLVMPNWEHISRAYEVNYMRIDNSESLNSSLSTIMKNPDSQLVEVLCNPSQRIMPTVRNYVDKSGKLRSNSMSEMIPEFLQNPNTDSIIIN